MGDFLFIKHNRTVLLEKYKNDIEKAKKYEKKKASFGWLTSILSSILINPTSDAKLAAQRFNWVREKFAALETIKNKPTTEQDFAHNKEALIILAQGRDLIKNDRNLQISFNNYNWWLLWNEFKPWLEFIGQKGKIERDFAACEKLLNEKEQLYTALKAEDIFPCTIDPTGKVVSLFDSAMQKIKTTKDALAKLAKGEASDTTLTNSEGDTICFGKKFSWKAQASPFLLRGLTAVKNYIEGQGGSITQDPNSGDIILGGSFVIHNDTGILLSSKHMKPPLALKNTPAEPSLPEPVTTTDLTPTQSATTPVAEPDAPTLTAKL